MAQDFEYIPGRYGYTVERTGDRSVAGRMPLLPSLQDETGALRCAAVLMAVDMTCGMAGGLGVLPNWTVTADADVHLLGACTVGPLRVDAEGVRPGRSMSVVDARVVDEGRDDALVAVATANHGVLESSFEHFLATAKVGDVQVFARPGHPDDQTLEDYFGLAVDGPVTTIPLTVRTTNPWGIFHGGLTGLLVDTAVRRAGLVGPTDVGLRFLNPARTGPATATVTADLERTGDRILRVEIRDGADGRLAVIAHVVGR